MPLTKTASPIRVMGRYLDNHCGPIPRVVVAANLKALKPNDWLTVYHGTSTMYAADLINGFDATKVKSRHYAGPRHKGLFVSPSFRTARSFGPTLVLEMVVRAKNLHGTDWSGTTGRQDPSREEVWRDKYPDSFRPYLSESLTQKSEPQALLQGLVAPRQIKRVWYASAPNEAGEWYSRKGFIDLGLQSNSGGRNSLKPLRDLGFDRSYPNYDYGEFIDAMEAIVGGSRSRSRIEQTLAQRADLSMIPGRSDTLAEIIEMDGRGFEPRAAKRYADRFREQLAAMRKNRRSVAASVSRVALRFASGRKTAASFVDEGMVGEDWGSSASGLFVTDGDRVLLLKRSPHVQDPGLWGIPGGAVPVDYDTGKRKDPKRSALDEAHEEMGGIPSGSVGGKHVFSKPSGFTFTTFVWETDPESLDQFAPRLNWEHTDWGLFDLHGITPSGIHPGVIWVLKRMGR